MSTTNISEALTIPTLTSMSSYTSHYGRDDETIIFEDRNKSVWWFMKHMPYFILKWYQRPEVWSKLQKELLIDTILMNGKIPGFMFQNLQKHRNGKRSWAVNDGQQRLLTLWQYINNKFYWKSPDGYFVYYDKKFDENDDTSKYRNMTDEERYTIDNYSFEWTEFHHSCSESAMKLNFKRINQGTHFKNPDKIGIAEDTNYIQHLIQGVFKVNEIDNTLEGLYEMGFFENFETSLFKKVDNIDSLFSNNDVPLIEAHERDMSNREVLEGLNPFIIAGLNHQVIPYDCAQKSIDTIKDYLDCEYTDEHILTVYNNLRRVTEIFKSAGQPGSNSKKRSMRKYTKLPCLVMYYEQNYQDLSSTILTGVRRLKWTKIIQYFEENDDRVKEFESVIICGETNRSRKESMIKIFCQRIVQKYPVETYPTFYEQEQEIEEEEIEEE